MAKKSTKKNKKNKVLGSLISLNLYSACNRQPASSVLHPPSSILRPPSSVLRHFS